MAHSEAPAGLAVSGFIWHRVVRPAQRSLPFFQDVLAGGPDRKSLPAINPKYESRESVHDTKSRPVEDAGVCCML